MRDSLLPLTKLVLAVSGATQVVFGLAGLITPGLVQQLLYPPPLEKSGTLAIQYYGAIYLASALGALYALRQNSWPAARTYLIIAGPFVAMCVVLTLLAAVTPPGIPLVLWLYVGLSVVYLPIVAWAWTQEAARQRTTKI